MAPAEAAFAYVGADGVMKAATGAEAGPGAVARCAAGAAGAAGAEFLGKSWRSTPRDVEAVARFSGIFPGEELMGSAGDVASETWDDVDGN